MIAFIRITTVLSFLLLFSFQTHAQNFLHTNGKAIVNESGDTVILKGMGLGGWMIQEGYMMQTSDFAGAQYQLRAKIEALIGPADTDLFYDTWLTNHVQKVDIDSLKSWGFNCVRLPMHYNLYTLPIEEEPVAGENTWLDKGFELTDSLLSWCAQNEMYVILDLHAAPGGQGYDQGISDYDPSKPSLWESQANRDKTVALWKRLAERYVDEPWVAAYDLINEPNWNMSGNVALRNLYETITDTIRAIDTKHILIIEGNWFANDFTGLTPPWDDNIVYGPHKYWSYNDQGSIQWVLDIRNNFDVPIFFGESGENSNTWFRDAIKLLEENQIGWAWWPMKKIESISGPLFIEKTPGYQALLDYWNGSGSQPSAAVAKAALMGMADQFKMENCTLHRDVIDAMFRQVYSDEAISYTIQAIPGVVYPSDFDMGVVGSAYSDSDLADYHVSTGNYTAWNSGWAYRNDGVDIEATNDNVNSNGYNVGWIATGEWMQYSVDVAESALYDVHVRVAANGSDGKFHFGIGDADVSQVSNVPNTGSWTTWQTVVVPNVVLDASDKKLRFYADAAGFNLGSMEFIQKEATSTISTYYLSAITLDAHTVKLHLNKPLAAPIPSSPANFQIFVNGSAVPITAAVLNTQNTRIITFTVDHTFKSSEVIKISYSGNQIFALDGTPLSAFTMELVKNTIAIVHAVPGKVEAEDFFFQSGIVLENTTDVGGGQNIGYLDSGDYLDYYINVAQAGFYKVFYRTASQSATGGLQLQKIDAGGGATVLHLVTFPPTGGWQTWATTGKLVDLPAGLHHIRIAITQPNFNMNWFEFTLFSSTEEALPLVELELFPNPTPGFFSLRGTLPERQDVELEIYDLLGNRLLSNTLRGVSELKEAIDLSAFPDGNYVLTLRMEGGRVYSKKVVKTSE
ncbi:MAG: carbohydrate-binding protein [Saprospirales bacterium]|nr:carbohydrate-binding protein [Saprospirales bacterium]